MSQRIGRNELCPCGSGKKAKNCHGEGYRAAGKNRTVLLVGAVIALVAIVAVVMMQGDSNLPLQAGPARPMTTTTTTPVTTAQTPASQNLNAPQPGPAPPGKVWSPEHGHWHDATGAQPAGTQNVQIPGAQPIQGGTQAMTPQPPGPAPAGKVWSPEHGHWHDLPGATAGPAAQPAQQAPATPAGTGP
ncbi:MAG: SEC-C metal-binding domain-containing protein [Candidatus Zixiibacteriota bacterium]